MLKRRLNGNGPWVVISTVLLAMLVTPFAIAAGENKPLLGGARNPGANETQELTRETEIIASNATYGTRQSNKSDNGGGAIYGCRSKAGGSEKNFEPCVRANNLSDGRAFEFESNGNEVGTIRSANPNAAPFTTNARGVATGLNADQVDGKSADDIRNEAVTAAQGLVRFAAVNSDGTVAGNRGVASATRVAEGTYQVVFSDDIGSCAFSATVTQFENAGAIGVGIGADKKTVTVRTRSGGNADGNDPTAPADRPFHLLAHC